MSYQSAIDQLNALAPELYTRPGQTRRKFSLEETRVLIGALGDPQRRFRSILIAGTNGKGSTAATIASILSVSGVRTGLYTSPHLARANERIRVGSAEIEDEAFARLYCRVHDTGQQLVLAERLPQLPSFFETLTAMAFLHFAEAGVELAVLEVGMGGRLDATNVVEPLLSIVTDISLDHTEWLGPTIAAITREKAGILRRGGTLVTLPQLPEANQVLGEMAEELGARGVNAAAYMPAMSAGRVGPYSVLALGTEVEVDSPLIGLHQQRNVALAIAAAVELATSHGLPVTPASIVNGVRETRWPGRLERMVACGREWILDVAHNPAGAWALRAALSGLPEEQRPQTLVFSCLRDKPLKEISQILFPLFDRVIFAPIHSARAAAMEDLEAAAVALGTTFVSGASVREALKLAVDRAQSGPIAISGSVYLVGEARPLLITGEGVGQ